jgi:hypothetical protein
MKIQSLKPLAIALMLALVPLSVSTAYAWSDHHNHHASSPPPLGGVNKFAYKVGDHGPGGGFIFFVDYYDQYRGFTYLEAAPTDIDPVNWCDDNNNSNSIYSPTPTVIEYWALKGVGKGQTNTTAMLAHCSSGAANSADLYVTGTKSDWFLPSLGELKLMFDNLLEAGVGGFANNYYWSSTEHGSGNVWNQHFGFGTQSANNKGYPFRVRAVRAF